MTVPEPTALNIRLPYVQVEEAIAGMIEQMEPGDQLPTEPALAKRLGVSRATLREALRTFVERGILVRRQGVGTFVASRIPTLEAGLEVLESLDHMAQRLGLTTKVTHLESVERWATPSELTGLGLPETQAIEVLAVDRVITVKDEPVADLRDVTPLTCLRQADLDGTFNGSVLELLLRRSHLMLSTSRTEIIAEEAEGRHAARLNVKRGAALLKFTAQLYTYDEKIVDYSISYFVPGHYKFHVMRRVQAQ
ncbi:MAG TPA: GntR family transcriptional regulator [Anaerolineae bacterium]|nr:GntR family transcriptional regulator [Anaerolineae bacterium]HQH39949.1 GntR family transcriptional regulator [Anaerolineae bacterium]